MTFVVPTVRVLAAILGAGMLSILATGCSPNTEAQAVPGSAKAAQLQQCVRPKAYMRRNHMELIKHQRDVTVHQGVRATTDSLAACVACHVQYDAKGSAIPVNADKQFCNGCHTWLAVQLDCFQCHATVPTGPQPSNLAHTWPEVFGTAAKNHRPIATPIAPITMTAPAVHTQHGGH